MYKLFCKKVTIALNVTVKITTQLLPSYYPFRKKLTFFLEGIATLSEMKLKNQLFRTEFDFTYEIGYSRLLWFSLNTPRFSLNKFQIFVEDSPDFLCKSNSCEKVLYYPISIFRSIAAYGPHIVIFACLIKISNVNSAVASGNNLGWFS